MLSSVENKPLADRARSRVQNGWSLKLASEGTKRYQIGRRRRYHALVLLTLTSKKSHIKWYRPAGRPPSSVKIERVFVGVSRQMDRPVGCTPVSRFTSFYDVAYESRSFKTVSRIDVTPYRYFCLLAPFFRSMTSILVVKCLFLRWFFSTLRAVRNFFACDVHTKRSGFWDGYCLNTTANAPRNQGRKRDSRLPANDSGAPTFLWVFVFYSIVTWPPCDITDSDAIEILWFHFLFFSSIISIRIPLVLVIEMLSRKHITV